MARKYILNATDFKKLTPVHRNTDTDLINQSIISCQDMFVVNITGSDLLDEIKGQLPSSLTNDNTTLLEEYLHPAMLYWIQAEIIRPLSYRFTNIGVQTKDSERSQPISEFEINKLENHMKSRAEFYATRAMRFLMENSTTYPLYENYGSGYDVVPPQKRMYRSGIYLGGLRGKRYTGLDTFTDEDNRK